MNSRFYTIHCPQREGMYPVNIGFVFLNKKFLNKVVIMRPAKTRDDPSFPFVLEIEKETETDVVEVFFDKQILVAESGCSLSLNQKAILVPRYSCSDEYIDLYVKDVTHDLIFCGYPLEVISQYTV